jgi:hypothetical protein
MLIAHMRRVLTWSRRTLISRRTDASRRLERFSRTKNLFPLCVENLKGEHRTHMWYPDSPRETTVWIFTAERAFQEIFIASCIGIVFRCARSDISHTYVVGAACLFGVRTSSSLKTHLPGTDRQRYHHSLTFRDRDRASPHVEMIRKSANPDIRSQVQVKYAYFEWVRAILHTAKR